MTASVERFYEQVAVGPGPDGAGGYEVLLDGRAVRTPQKHALRLPVQGLAEPFGRGLRRQVRSAVGLRDHLIHDAQPREDVVDGNIC